MMGFGGGQQPSTYGGFGKWLRNKYNDARGTLAATFNPVSDSPDLHRSTAKKMTELFSNVVPPETAALGTELLGIGNEGIAALLAPLSGAPMIGKQGFDIEDIRQNRLGEDQALAGNGGFGSVIGGNYGSTAMSAMARKALRRILP